MYIEPHTAQKGEGAGGDRSENWLLKEPSDGDGKGSGRSKVAALLIH